MSESATELGTFVRHDTFGVGRVAPHDDSDRVLIEFKSGGDRYVSRRVAAGLKVLPDDGLEVLLWTNPDETRAWATEAPLKLLAATLADIGGTAKTAAIREKLEGRVLDDGVKWASWWGNVRSAASESSYFTVDKNKSNAITGLGLSRGVHVKDILVGSLPEKPRPSRRSKNKPASKQQWKNWLLTEIEGPVPGRWPNSKVFGDLDKWTADEVERALTRTIRGARDFLESGSTADKGRASWLDAVSRVSLRLRECMEPDSDRGLVAQVGKLLCEATKLNEGDTFDWPGLAHALAARPDGWHGAFTAGIWSALAERPREIRDTFRMLGVRLGRRNATALAEEVCLAAFRPGESPHRNLDAILDALHADERPILLYNLIVRSAVEDRRGQEVVDYVGATRHATDANLRLGLLVLSALLIPDGQSRIFAEASGRLADILEFPEQGEVPLQVLFQEVRVRNERLRADIAAEFESQRRVYEVQLERGRLEEARLRQQAATFRAQMESGRQESRLEVRRGMLLAIGDVLQRAYGPGRSADERLLDVIATVPTVLREGGAEPLGTVGEALPFDPRLHHSKTNLPRGTAVRVLVPGVIASGGAFGDNVILKATVTRHSGVV